WMCVCASMMPGSTSSPEASITRSFGPGWMESATSEIVWSSNATSACHTFSALTTVPLLMMVRVMWCASPVWLLALRDRLLVDQRARDLDVTLDYRPLIVGRQLALSDHPPAC